MSQLFEHNNSYSTALKCNDFIYMELYIFNGAHKVALTGLNHLLEFVKSWQIGYQSMPILYN